MTAALSTLTNDQLGNEITTWAGRLAAGEARLLEMIGEFDVREAWAGPGLLSCAHWLSWRLGIGLTAARERVRVAGCLRSLPTLAAAYADGRLSWTQVRAITRVSEVLVEEDWIVYARAMTGEQLEQLVRTVNRATKPERDKADPERAAWLKRPKVRHLDDGLMQISFTVPEESGQVVLAGLERLTQQIQQERDAERAATAHQATPGHGGAHGEGTDDSAESSEVDEPGPARGTVELLPRPVEPQIGDWGDMSDAERVAVKAYYDELMRVNAHNLPLMAEQQAAQQAQREAHLAQVAADLPATWNDALVRLATGALDSPGLLPIAVKERLRIVIDPMSGWARTSGGELLPPGTVAVPSDPFTALDLAAFDLGRTSRLVSPRLRRFLGDLDGECCRFPGCTRKGKLQAHHVTFWRNGGPTDLANLVLVCSRHHTLIHSKGFQLVLTPDRQLTVRTVDDIPVPQRPVRPFGDDGALPDSTPDTLSPQLDGTQPDWEWAVYVIANQPRACGQDDSAESSVDSP
jgi:hypothetical protein